MRQIISLEKQFMTIPFPASGSLYYRRDLEASQATIPLPGQSSLPPFDQVVVGPTAQYEWWYRERALLDVDRGPCMSLFYCETFVHILTWTGNTFLSCFKAPAIREIEFCKRFGKPRLHVERYLRELHEFKERSPTTHIHLLSDYLKLAPGLDISGQDFSRPVLRHPDFSPNNILLDSSNDIIGIIDWQHATILPLCLCAGIPNHFQNWGDLLSETLAKPETKLPDNFATLSQDEQETIKETMRRRLVHFYYAALTLRQITDHFDALRDENAMLRAKLFSRATAPWEGDSTSLRYALQQACRNWPMGISFGNTTAAATPPCPLTYSEEEMQQCENEHDHEQDKLQELTEMKDLIGIDSVGWVPDDEHLQAARAMVETIKAGLLEHSSTEIERVAVRDHFPFDDHDEV